MRKRVKIGKPDKKLFPELSSLSKNKKDPWYEDIKDWIVTEYNSVRYLICHSIPNYFRNLVRYNKLMWKTEYWDYQYLMDIEKKFIEIMLERYEKGDDVYIADNEVDMMKRDLRLLHKLIDMMSNYAELDEDAEVNMNNKHRFVHESIMNNPNFNNNDRWSFRVLVREEKIWNLYCLIRKYKIRSICD